MRGVDSYTLSNAGVGSTQFTINGGMYNLSAVGTWSTGSLDLQVLCADGATYVTVLSATVSANKAVLGLNLAPGKYQWVVNTGASAVYANLTRVPGE